MNTTITCELVVVGNVQGVGLRKKIKAKAEELSLTGLAANLPPPICGVKITLQGRWTSIVNLSAWLKEIKGVTGVESHRIFDHLVFEKFETK